jgi:hypothetical protein
MKIAKTAKLSKKVPPEKTDPHKLLTDYVMECHRVGEEYQRKFRDRWNKIESQARCVHPDEWDKKEDWQTKVFVPQQSKTFETAEAYLDKMLFGQKRFFSIRGVDKRDREQENSIETIFDYVFDKGGFYSENEFVLKEACGATGTGFIKILVDKERGIKFVWRSAYNVRIDPSCGSRFYEKGWLTDEYKRPLQELVTESENGDSIYSKESIQKLIEVGAEAALSKTDQAMTIIKGFDGNEVKIASLYKEVTITEFWGKTKVKREAQENDGKKEAYVMEDRIVAVGNGTVKMRDDKNEYGFIPYFVCRVKPRKYEAYGLGFGDNTVDLQDLTNSMLCLGFDSLKICSMDFAAVDANKIKEPASIEYRPMAVWLMKGNPNEALALRRQGISALGEIMRGLVLLDQFQQEASGVLRQIQGAPEAGGGSETLGEYHAKLAMIDNRFLKIGRFIERDYIEPMLKGMFKMLFNSKFFNQNFVDRVLGMRTVTSQMPDGLGGFKTITRQVSKLDFNEMAQKQGEICYDFRAVGMTQFSKAIETLQKLKELLEFATKNPQIMILSRIDEIYKRVLQAAEIPDYEELIKSDEEIEGIMQQIYSGAPPQPGMQGAPQAAPVPQPAGAY